MATRARTPLFRGRGRSCEPSVRAGAVAVCTTSTSWRPTPRGRHALAPWPSESRTAGDRDVRPSTMVSFTTRRCP